MNEVSLEKEWLYFQGEVSTVPKSSPRPCKKFLVSNRYLNPGNLGVEPVLKHSPSDAEFHLRGENMKDINLRLR